MCGENCSSLSQFTDRRGFSIGLFGSCCYSYAIKAVDETPTRYGELTSSEIRDFVFNRANELKQH